MSSSVTVNPFFTPTQISGCQLWLDAADPSSLVLSGSNVTQWRDKSGNGRNASSGGATPPTYRNTSINFAGSQYYSTSYSSAQSTETFFIVCRWANVTSDTSLIAGTLINQRIFYVSPSSSRWLYLGGIGAWGVFNTTPFLINTTYLVNFSWNALVPLIYLNTNQLSTSSIGSPSAFSGSPTTSRIGETFIGSMFEIIGFNVVLTLGQRQQVEGYLAWKWGLQSSLPANHPYKNSPIPPLLNPPVTLTPATPNLQWVNWSPLQVSGCALWLDAATTFSGFTNGQSISSWRDRSSNGFIGSAINSPTILTNSINGLPAVRLNGTNQYIDFGNVINMGTSQIYVFSVVRFSGDGAIVQKSSFRGNAGRWLLARITGDGGMVMGIDATGGGVVAPFADTTTTTQMVAGYWDRNTIYTFQNGTQRASASLVSSTNLSNTDPLYVGAYGNSSGTGPQAGLFLNGVVGEILVYLTSMTVLERQQVEGYLAWKWGLVALLPSTHPYKNAPPFTPTLALPLRSVLQTAAFTPLRINGCTLWLDSADLSTFTFSGTNLTQWRDKSSTGAVFNASATSPTQSTRTYNGLRPVSFGGSSFFQNTTFVFTTSSRTTFFVYDETTEQNNVGVLSFASSGTDFNQLNTMVYETGFKTSQYLQLAQGFQNGGYALQIQNSPISFALYSDTFGSGTEIAYVNGLQTATTTSGGAFTNSTGLILGARMSGGTVNNNLIGVIGEVILFNRPLSTAERQQVEGYLAWKWGLQANLPASHPFKRWPPPPQ